MQKYAQSLIIRDIQVKTQGDATSNSLERLISKKSEIENMYEDMERFEHLDPVPEII